MKRVLIDDSNFGAAMASVLMSTAMHAKYTPRPPPTPEQIAAADKRTERERWNDEVDRKKAEKKYGPLPKEPTDV